MLDAGSLIANQSQGIIAMGSTAPIESYEQVETKRADGNTKDNERDALREENQQLKELVVQLSQLIVRNVVESK
jgi:hypothetical protein